MLEYDAWWIVDPEESGESWWPVTTETVFVVERRGPVLETDVEAGGSVARVRLRTTMRRGTAVRIRANMAVVNK